MTALLAMVFDRDLPSIFEFYPAHLIARYYAMQIGALSAVALIVAFLYSLVMNSGNPIVALRNTVVGLFQGLAEVLTLPLGWRRISAIAGLTVKECIRRRILFVFVLFLLPFLFAGWYLDQSPREGRMISYIAFVNIAMTWLLLPLVVFLASMSIPTDLLQRTIQTVATKPVRRSELVVGRIVGFMVIFTGVLLVMGGVSLAYLAANVTDADRQTTWTARVPVYSFGSRGKPQVYFVKENVVREGNTGGTNVGKEWSYRSHIQGATDDSAHWVFNFDPSVFKGRYKNKKGEDVARIQATFNIFKTTKGDPTRDGSDKAGVWGRLSVRERKEKSIEWTSNFRVNNNRINELEVPVSVLGSGEVEVVARCLTRNQFIGMAGPDLYFLANEGRFEINFLKSLVGLWLKLLLVVSVAVSASTVLKGFITVLFTVMVYIVGYFYTFMYVVARSETVGGGPIESMVRIFKQSNQVNPLEESFIMQVLLGMDKVVLAMMRSLSNIVPDLQNLDLASYVAQGFDIPPITIFHNVLMTLGYVVPVIVLGCFLLRNRELAV